MSIDSPVSVSVMVERASLNSPTVPVVRYVAEGSSSPQLQVVVPSPLSVRALSSPIPSPMCVEGTVKVVSKVALSDGWLFEGNQPWAPIGSFTTKAPSQTGVPGGGALFV